MTERWLVIDDSSTIQRVIKLAFQSYDVMIGEADSIQDAVRDILRQTPSLIIADAALGGLQGVSDFVNLKQAAPLVPFIVLGGSYDNIDEAQFRAVGFSFFLRKPFDASQLLSITREALGRALPYRGDPMVPQVPPPLDRVTVPSSASIAEEQELSGFDLGLNDVKAIQTSSKLSAAVEAEAGKLLRSLHLEDPQESSLRRKEAKAPIADAAPRRSSSTEAAHQILAGKHLSQVKAPTPDQDWIRPAGSQLPNLLEPMLQEEIEKLVRVGVEDYCRKHFSGIARDLIQKEIERLTAERQRHLME